MCYKIKARYEVKDYSGDEKHLRDTLIQFMVDLTRVYLFVLVSFSRTNSNILSENPLMVAEHFGHGHFCCILQLIALELVLRHFVALSWWNYH